MKSLLWVVVGAGFPGYFRNSLRSVAQNSSSDVLAIYNSIDLNDWPGSEEELPKNPNANFSLAVRPNSGGDAKTGQLYEAYNFALDYADNKYDFVSFLQSDMQLIDWPISAPQLLADIFSEPEFSVFCVGSAAPCQGAFLRPDLPPSSSNSGFSVARADYKINPDRAVSDVAVYSTALVRTERFRFSESEGDCSAQMVRRGFAMAEMTEPQMVFLPWPAVVRDGQRRGSDFDSPDSLILRRTHNYRDGVRDEGLRWAEALVGPNGFRTLYPYWPTDILRPKWLSRRRAVVRELGLPFFTSIEADGTLGNFLARGEHRRVPTLRFVIAAIFLATVQNIKHLLRDILVSIYRRISCRNSSARGWGL